MTNPLYIKIYVHILCHVVCQVQILNYIFDISLWSWYQIVFELLNSKKLRRRCCCFGVFFSLFFFVFKHTRTPNYTLMLAIEDKNALAKKNVLAMIDTIFLMLLIKLLKMKTIPIYLYFLFSILLQTFQRTANLNWYANFRWAFESI